MESSSLFTELLNKPVSARPESQVQKRLGAASADAAIHTIAAGNPSVFKLAADGGVEFQIQMRVRGQTVAQHVRVEIEPGATADQAKYRVTMPALEKSASFQGMIDQADRDAICQSARTEINGRLRDLGLVKADVGQVRGALESRSAGAVDQADIPAGTYQAAAQKVPEDARQRAAAQKWLEDQHIRHFVVPTAKAQLDAVLAIDPAKDPQAFAAKLKEVGLDTKDVDMLKVVAGDAAEREKLSEIHRGAQDMRQRLETDPVGFVRDTRVDITAREGRAAAEIASHLPPKSILGAAGDVAGALGRKLPMIGAGVAGVQMAMSASAAQAAHAEGRIDEQQLAAVVAASAGMEGCAAVATVPIAGTAASVACEEGIEAGLVRAGVPQDLRPGTTGQALDGMAKAIAQATKPLRDKATQREQEQRENDTWRTRQTELAVALHDTGKAGGTKATLDALQGIRKTDRVGAAALQQAMLDNPEQAEALLRSYQQAQAAGVAQRGERIASSEASTAPPTAPPPQRPQTAAAAAR